MDITLTRLVIAVSMLALIGISVVYYETYMSSIKQNKVEYVKSILEQASSLAEVQGNITLYGVRFEDASLSIYKPKIEVTIRYADFQFLEKISKDLNSDQLRNILETLQSIYSFNVTLESLNITFNGKKMPNVPTNLSIIEVINNTIEIPASGTGKTNTLIQGGKANASFTYFFYRNSLILVPRIFIYVKQPSSSLDYYVITIKIPKVSLDCGASSCEKITGYYDVHVSTTSVQLTDEPFEITAPWKNGETLIVDTKLVKSYIPQSLLNNGTQLLQVDRNSKLAILVVLQNYTITLVQER